MPLSIPALSNFEKDRVEDLRNLELLGSSKEASYDQLTALAANMIGAEMCFVSFIDEDTIWFKSTIGMELKSVPRQGSICKSVIESGQEIIVPDLALDDRFNFLPECSGPKALRFYAGLPLRSPKGFVIGTFCVLGFHVKDVKSDQLSLIRTLANQIEQLIALRAKSMEVRHCALRKRAEGVALDYLHEGVMLQDCDGRVLEANLAALEILGLPMDVLQNSSHKKTFWKAIHADGSEYLPSEHPAARALESGKKQIDLLIGLLRPGSDVLWLKVTSLPLRLQDGEQYTHAIICFQELGESEKLRIEREILDKAMRTSSKLAALGEMAAMVAHEIENPLAIITGHAGLLKERLQEGSSFIDAQLKAVETIEKTSLRIGKIVKSLRLVSQSGELDPLKPEKIAVLLNETIELCSARYRSAGVRLDVNCNIDVQVWCRPCEIAQIILNLLSNALHAAARTEKWVRIEVKLSTSLHQHGEASQVTLTVLDSGQGIEDNVANRMMEPFFTTKTQGLGTGLGLSISRSLARSQGGDLRYEKVDGHTAFLLTLETAP